MLSGLPTPDRFEDARDARFDAPSRRHGLGTIRARGTLLGALRNCRSHQHAHPHRGAAAGPDLALHVVTVAQSSAEVQSE